MQLGGKKGCCAEVGEERIGSGFDQNTLFIGKQHIKSEIFITTSPIGLYLNGNVTQADLTLSMFSPGPPECWGWRSAPLYVTSLDAIELLRRFIHIFACSLDTK